MKNQDLFRKSLSPSTRYSEAFKRAVVKDYERGILNKAQIQSKYGIGGKSRVLEWCRKYGKLHYPKFSSIGRPMKDPQKQRIKELEKQLEDARLKVLAYEKLISVTEKEEGISILKKGRCQTIDELAKTYPRKVSMFCELFGFTKQAYYKHQSYKKTSDSERLKLKESVLLIRRQLPRLGVRKLYYLLSLSGKIHVGRDKLFSILREEGLLVSRRRKYTATTNSKHWLRKYPNLTQDISLERPEQLWVADITYIDTLEGNAYLHLVTDAYSKQIMGYELCDTMEASSTLKALKIALCKRKYKASELIHHSDRGLQYCSKLYTDCLKENGINISMTENGDPYENAIAERVNGILKDEFGLYDKFENILQAKELARQSIQIYNQLRPHLSCSMFTPNQMHQQDRIKLISFKKKKFRHLVNV
ncbi:IS3 family transposase [Elizabethkingia meningoseptica]|uniref:IS3 family transposase n=2 Tax=Elizabethkingia TaxID=308865 RepID=UPI001112F617|nr:IS3 family transposase [Elizabethkingia meningoseptica]